MNLNSAEFILSAQSYGYQLMSEPETTLLVRTDAVSYLEYILVRNGQPAKYGSLTITWRDVEHVASYAYTTWKLQLNSYETYVKFKSKYMCYLLDEITAFGLQPTSQDKVALLSLTDSSGNLWTAADHES